LSKYGSHNYPTNAKELFNLRHSLLRVTVERALVHSRIDLECLTTNPSILTRLKSRLSWHAAFSTIGYLALEKTKLCLQRITLKVPFLRHMIPNLWETCCPKILLGWPLGGMAFVMPCVLVGDL